MPDVKVYDREGRPQVLPAEEAAARWEAGEVAFGGDRVAVRSPDGQLGFVDNDPEELRQAFGGGFGLAPLEEAEREEQLASADNAGLAFAEQAARLPIVGNIPELVAREVARGNTGADREEQRAAQEYLDSFEAREEANPVAGTLGEVGSDLATLALTGGGGLAARGGTAVGEAVLARAGTGLASRALGSAARLGTEGAIEGAILGGEDVLTEAALGDTELTGERLATGIGFGALLGAGTGAALGGTGRLLGEAGKRSVTAARRRAEQLIPQIQEAVSPEGLQRFAQETAFRSLRPVKRYTDRAARQAGGIEGVGEILLRRNVVTNDATLETMATRLDELVPQVGDEISSIVRRADTIPGVRPNAQRIRAKVQELQEQFATAATGSQRRIARQLEDELRPFFQQLDEAGEEGISAEQVWMLRRELDDSINWRVRSQDSPPKLNEALQDVRRLVEDEVDATVQRAGREVGEDLGQAYRNAKRDYAGLVLSRDVAADRLSREAANRSFSLTDYMSGIVGAAGTGALDLGVPGAGLAAGFLLGRLNKLLRERGNQVLAATGNRLAIMRAARRESQKVATRVESRVDAYLDRVMQGGRAAARTTGRNAARAARVASIAAFDERVKNVRETAADPAAITEQLGEKTSTLAQVAPQTAAAMQRTAMRDLKFLHDRLPAGTQPRGGLMASMAPPRLVSDVERMRWMRYYDAVEEPESVLEDLEAGELTREGVEALKETRPAMYRTLVRRVMERLATAEEPVPYQERLQLGLLLGVPTDPSLEPRFVASMQASYAGASEDPTQPQAPVASPRPTPQLAGQSMSETQRLERNR